ncbi:type II toxin-antitoxin system PemK/MazF family toxin [Synechococcales cyanobacterium C]|uniref:Type II toxin-antitoxin system PemK/MazF family toxin n=2 Tax=Petrachloros TaxID=2918834 RepID=A0A8K1ZXS4_9CYAN|nr:type II toxin-antitoxin system PemK/MazF family toxin [Petrachloros mirabilis ULC683]
MVIYKQFDVVVVPFPFTNKTATKRRPALVLSSELFNVGIYHSVMAMITTASHSPWPLDVTITDLKDAGLKVSSTVRMKLFTIDHVLILKQIGYLSVHDQGSVRSALRLLLS